LIFDGIENVVVGPVAGHGISTIDPLIRDQVLFDKCVEVAFAIARPFCRGFRIRISLSSTLVVRPD
jgi:hypothetical protein